MSHQTPKRLILSCAGMDLCWLCAAANFLVTASTPLSFPLLTLVAAYFAGTLGSIFFQAQRGRLIWPILAHGAGIGLLTTAVLSAASILKSPESIREWYYTLLLICLAVLFWYKGMTAGRRQWSYISVCNHFDLGIAFFFALLIVKLLIYVKAEINIPDLLTLDAMLLYFLFSPIAIFTTCPSHGPEKQFLKGFRIYGILIAAVVLILLTGTGIALICCFKTGGEPACPPHYCRPQIYPGPKAL